jgi:hypothetical protein
LHDSKINGEISWFFDGIRKVKLGDPSNGYDAEAVVRSLDGAAEWLRATAVRLYPEGPSAPRYDGVSRSADGAGQRRPTPGAVNRLVPRCAHRVEPDLAAIAERYGPELPVNERLAGAPRLRTMRVEAC